jgi:hypothetical protein
MSKTSADDKSNQAVLPVSISTLPPSGNGVLRLPTAMTGAMPLRPGSVACRPVPAEA